MSFYKHKNPWWDEKNADMWDVTLVCQHVLFFRAVHLPKKSESCWCASCQMNMPIHSINGPYKYWCATCNRSRSFGLQKRTAEVMAQAHANKRGHEVKWYKVGSPDTAKMIKPETQVIPGIIPF